jgi:hypothetical protein
MKLLLKKKKRKQRRSYDKLEILDFTKKPVIILWRRKLESGIENAFISTLHFSITCKFPSAFPST